MSAHLKIAMIGLDTSHAVEFSRRIQAPDYHSVKDRITGLTVTRCLRFATPFQTESGLDLRQRQLEAWNVQVTRDFATAVAACDALMLEINDPAWHYPYFQRCLSLRKPIFMDKPLADTLPHGKTMLRQAADSGIPFFSASALRYDPAVTTAAMHCPFPLTAIVRGPLAQAPAGSSLLWYGVHCFEILQRLMGCGAGNVQVDRQAAGYLVRVNYRDGRSGTVELDSATPHYGGVLSAPGQQDVAFTVASPPVFYDFLLEQIARFFTSGKAPLSPSEMQETMALLDAAERALQSGRPEPLSP